MKKILRCEFKSFIDLSGGKKEQVYRIDVQRGVEKESYEVITQDDVLDLSGKYFEVDVVGDRAFQGSFFKKIILANTVVKLGDKSFQRCMKLASFPVPVRLQEIGVRAFDHCQRLKTVLPADEEPMNEGNFRLPETVSHIASSAFECAAVRFVHLHAALEFLGDDCFYNSCLERLYIARNPKDPPLKIGKLIFARCQYLRSVIYRGLKPLPKNVFTGCPSRIKIMKEPFLTPKPSAIASRPTRHHVPEKEASFASVLPPAATQSAENIERVVVITPRGLAQPGERGTSPATISQPVMTLLSMLRQLVSAHSTQTSPLPMCKLLASSVLLPATEMSKPPRKNESKLQVESATLTLS